MKINASWENINDTGQTPDPISLPIRTKSIYMRKTLPLIRLGAYVPLNKSFSLRFITTWLQTSKLQKYIPSAPGNNSSLLIKEQNNFQYSLGLVYIF